MSATQPAAARASCHPRESGDPENSRELLPSKLLPATDYGGYDPDARLRGHDSEKMVERRTSVTIMASRRNGTLYVGMTNHLAARAFQHRSGVGSQFTAKYGVKMLVWYEHYGQVNDAIAREKQLKTWERRWKLDLIERFNPNWAVLYETLNC